MYIRYKQMSEVLKLINARRYDVIINTVALVLGLVSAFGLTMVANFQVVVHCPRCMMGINTIYERILMAYTYIGPLLHWRHNTNTHKAPQITTKNNLRTFNQNVH